jgi:DNA-binding CsgD family transcriptional regulator
VALSRPDLHRRDELVARAGRATDPHSLFAEASTRLREIVRFDAALWMATDPATGLPAAPLRVENIDGDHCAGYWAREFLVEDVNRYTDLAKLAIPVAALRASTDDNPARSARYREFIRPQGLDDELRAIFRAGGSPWGEVSLMRRLGRPAFSAEDIEVVVGLTSPLAECLRAHAQAEPTFPADGPLDGPGLLMFDVDGALVSVNDEATSWLDSVPETNLCPTPLGVSVPTWVTSTAVRARAIAVERGRGNARVRVRGRTGLWLTCQASCLRDAHGEIGNTVMVIGPSRASEIVPIIEEAYELSPRERQVAQLISRGLGTAEISGELHLSGHTVRDHIEAIFEKVGVSSRGELVAKLFAEHYLPLHKADRMTVMDS